MLAVRANERAAAASGINVATIKLAAFALSAFIAAIGGGVLAYQFSATAGSSFGSMLSLTVVAMAFIGGIASVSGALQAGFLSSGGVLYVLLNNISGISKYWDVVMGVLLVATVVTQPDGIAIKNMQLRAALVRAVGRRRPVRARQRIQLKERQS
jgi:branched-chain amino acid transport system permease protein